MKISLAVITFNEQHNIVPLLTNVCDIFDQIVIVDGGSPDKTIKLIEDYRKDTESDKIKLRIQPQNGPRYSKAWKQSAQRNIALDECTGDWVFTMDADERLDVNARIQLEKLVLEKKPSCIAWAMPTRHYWETPDQIRCDKHWWPNYHYRFWQNGLNIRYSPHYRHCYPMIPQYPDVRKQLDEMESAPYSGVIIHHYHHCPVKKLGFVYRANFKDVRDVNQLEKGLKKKRVKPREKTEKEKQWERERLLQESQDKTAHI